MTQTLIELEDGSITHFTETEDGFATLDTDSYLRVWSRDGKARGKVKAGGGRMIRLQAITVGPDGALLTWTTKIAAYDPTTAKRIREWKGHGKHSEISGLALTQGGTRLVSGAHVSLASSANGVRVWDYAGGDALEVIPLPSPVRKHGCEVHALGRAPSSDVVFALAYSRQGPDEKIGGAYYLFRCEGGKAEQIAECLAPKPMGQDTETMLTVLAITDRYLVTSKTTQYPEPGAPLAPFAPSLEVRSHDGALVGAHALEPALPTVRAFRYEHVAVSPDGARVAVVVGDGIEIRALPSLELEVHIPITDAAVDRLAFARAGGLLAACGARIRALALPS